MRIAGIGAARLPERRDRRIALAELFANFAEREPRRHKGGREFDSLIQQIRGGSEVTLELQVARKFIAAVGNQIAGGQKQARGHCPYIRHCRT